MASGDHVRAWFPEMIEELKIRWNKELTWSDYALLCSEMTLLRSRIKLSKNIHEKMCICNKCGTLTKLGPLDVSIRSIFFALLNHKIINKNQFLKLENSWKRFQKLHRLDPYGKKRDLNNSQ